MISSSAESGSGLTTNDVVALANAVKTFADVATVTTGTSEGDKLQREATKAATLLTSIVARAAAAELKEAEGRP